MERLANAAELSDAFGVSHSTVYRYQRCYRENGVSGLSYQRSARGGYKLKGEKRLEAQRLLDQGESARATARAIGVSRMAIDYALKQGTVRRRAMARETAGTGSQPSARSRTDAGCGGGIGVKRTTERLLAQYGKLHEAAVCFEAAQSVADGGVLIALPALLTGAGLAGSRRVGIRCAAEWIFRFAARVADPGADGVAADSQSGTAQSARTG